jgi:tryptophanyl-tRNA synthetase
VCGAGEIKQELSTVLMDLVGRHQRARAAVSEAVVDAFMAVRPMALVAAGKA